MNEGPKRDKIKIIETFKHGTQVNLTQTRNQNN